MKYSFELFEYFDERDNSKKTSPLLKIEDHLKYGDYFLDEITNLSLEYLNEIVFSLERVLLEELEQYDFGYEVYLIECKKEVSSVIDTFQNWKSIAFVSTQELYELMRDWLDYSKEHNKSKNPA